MLSVNQSLMLAFSLVASASGNTAFAIEPEVCTLNPTTMEYRCTSWAPAPAPATPPAPQVTDPSATTWTFIPAPTYGPATGCSLNATTMEYWCSSWGAKPTYAPCPPEQAFCTPQQIDPSSSASWTPPASTPPSPPPPAAVLTGDTALACEAILCLAAVTRPSECIRSLTRFFSINLRTWTRTLTARRGFLSLCPAAEANATVASLIESAVQSGAGCSLDQLNGQVTNDGNGNVAISNYMSPACSSWYSNPIIAAQGYTPAYVGEPHLGGYWVDPAEYPAAQAAWQKVQDDAAAAALANNEPNRGGGS